MRIFLLSLLIVPLQLSLGFITSFVPSLPTNRLTSTHLSIFGPKQALMMEEKKDPKKFEATIKNLMKQKKLTRPQAEKRYGEFLLDPDGFALRASEAARKEAGYKTWEEAAIGRSSDPEGTRERIENFKQESQIKALAVISVFVGALLYLSSTKQVVSFNGVEPNPVTNPYYQSKILREQ